MKHRILFIFAALVILLCQSGCMVKNLMQATNDLKKTAEQMRKQFAEKAEDPNSTTDELNDRLTEYLERINEVKQNIEELQANRLKMSPKKLMEEVEKYNLILRELQKDLLFIDNALHKTREEILASDISFEFNSHVLLNDGEKALDRFAQSIKKSINDFRSDTLFDDQVLLVKIKVTGYADGIGSEEYNLNLSQKRAESVYKYLRTKLPNHENINIKEEVIGRGQALPYPESPNNPYKKRDARRRICIISSYVILESLFNDTP